MADNRCSPDLCRLARDAEGVQEGLDQVYIKGVSRLPVGDGVLAYNTSWTIRGVLLLKMRIAKVLQLKAGAWMPGQLVNVNSDKTTNLHRVFVAGNNRGVQKYKTIGDLMQNAGRVRRPELLSMDCCFAGDPAHSTS